MKMGKDKRTLDVILTTIRVFSFLFFLVEAITRSANGGLWYLGAVFATLLAACFAVSLIYQHKGEVE
jgi:hypothetical protein